MRIIVIFTLLVGCIHHLIAQNRHPLIIGTYTKGISEGVYVYDFDSKSGNSYFKSKIKCNNPSFVAISSHNKWVFVVEEENDNPQVASYAFDNATGSLKLINKQPTLGAHPCYVSVDKTNKWVFVGNYTGGSVSCFGVDDNGRLQPATQTLQHKGSSANTKRQEAAHVHGAFIAPSEKLLFVPDLGIDQLKIYSIDKLNVKQPLSISDSVKVNPGSGPRHLAFHPNGKYLYLLLELTAEIEVFEFVNEQLISKQKISLLPVGYKGSYSGADIHTSTDGKFLYATNRGDANHIISYNINETNGLLSKIDIQSTGGLIPRNFTMDPSGNFLLVANQESSEIIVFKRNQKTGLLKKTKKKISVGHPVCLVFAE